LILFTRLQILESDIFLGISKFIAFIINLKHIQLA
jgi:hypothetical protein